MEDSKIFFLKCREEVDVDAIKKRGVKIINSHYIASREHLEFAIRHAEKAFERGENISKDPFVELVVRCSGQRQIKRALALFGMRGREIAIIGQTPHELKDYQCTETKLEMTEEKYQRVKAAFGIDEREVTAVAEGDLAKKAKALVEIIKERIALIAIA